MSGFLQSVKDMLFFPFRILLPDAMVEKLGLTSLERERIAAVFPLIQGRLLDIGAGNNKLVMEYGNGIGIDVYDQEGGAMVVADSSDLPFPNASFDTVTFLACLNHIPDRKEVLQEAHRLLKSDGKLIITMINPLSGFIIHKVAWFYPDNRRHWEQGERYGLSTAELLQLCREAGFDLIKHQKFVYHLNNAYIFRVTN